MPAIAEFQGITLFIYYPPREHPPPHFHAIYADQDASFDIRTDPRFFAQAYLDLQTRTVAWPGGIDLDPEGLREEADMHRIRVDPRISRLAS
jgi:hypothetical protein